MVRWRASLRLSVCVTIIIIGVNYVGIDRGENGVVDWWHDRCGDCVRGRGIGGSLGVTHDGIDALGAIGEGKSYPKS